MPEEQEKSSEEQEKKIDDALLHVDADRKGLSSDQVAARKEQYGANVLPQMKPHLVRKFLSFFWNPIAWAMEVAAILSFILVDYIDGILILGLLIFNACIGFWEDYSSGNAVAALQQKLVATCWCLRDGKMTEVSSEELVPGDIVLLRIGAVIPADMCLMEGDFLKVDQSSLTGESIAVDRFPGDEVYSGSIVKQGEMKGVVTATGRNTFFGRAAVKIGETEKKSHIQHILKIIGYFCISFVIMGVILELIIQFGVRHKSCTGVAFGACTTLDNILVLIVGGLPIAMPAILSITLAIGATQLAKKEAIVTRLTAIEEVAGIEVLCSDKTGTLTKNKLTITEPIVYSKSHTKHNMMNIAALASAKGEAGDAIDLAIYSYCDDAQRAEIDKFEVLHFTPFDPVSKRATAKVRGPDGELFRATKGAPQVIVRLSQNASKVGKRATRDVERLGKAGYRALGVALGDEKGEKWEMLGMIPLFDPPRDDTKETIERAQEYGVKVKMITGDHAAIAKETARMIGMGDNIYTAKMMKDEDYAMQQTGMTTKEIISAADGFAEVLPDDKYAVVEQLQYGGHLIGMTGDGVNDAPALKKANVGIAVSGSTDAARSAADIVLTKEGLSTIVDAIITSRKIAQRMKNYCMYSIAATVRIVLTFTLLTVIYDFEFPTIAVVLFAIFNDGSMLTISKDRVKPRKEPEHWNKIEIFGTAMILGLYLTLSTVLLFELAVNTPVFHNWFGVRQLSQADARGLIYLQVSASGLATIFVTRTQGWSWMFWREPPSIMLVCAYIVAQTAATILCAYGLGCWSLDNVDFCGSGWAFVLIGWIWVLLWYPLMDPLKFIARAIFRGRVTFFRHSYWVRLRLSKHVDQPAQTAGNGGVRPRAASITKLAPDLWQPVDVAGNIRRAVAKGRSAVGRAFGKLAFWKKKKKDGQDADGAAGQANGPARKVDAADKKEGSGDKKDEASTSRPDAV